MKSYNVIFFELIGMIKRCVAIIVFIVLNYSVWPQTISNIDLPSAPEVGGSMAADLISTNGYIFIYSLDGIKIFNESNSSFVNLISFETNYGKFNPIYSNERLNFGNSSLMALNEELDILYVIYPNLIIKGISTNPPFNVISSFNPVESGPPPSLPSYFAPLHRGCILNFDSIHKRLYWVIFGHNPEDDCVGNFHQASRFFAIFNVNQSGNLSWFYTEFKGSEDNYYLKNISDVQFNHNNNFYYLTKLNRIEVWEVTNGPEKVILKDSIIVPYEIYGGSEQDPDFYKFSKMLYLNNENVHQIIALPYKFPSSKLEEGYFPLVFILDGDWNGTGTVPYTTFIAPSEEIYDGIVLHHEGQSDLDDLILSYAPVTDIYLTYPNTDIAIFRYNASGYYEPKQHFLTENSLKISEYDINSSFKLLNIDNANSLLIGKKDGVSKIMYNGSSDLYSLQPALLSSESNFFRNGVTNNVKSFFINSAGNGIDIFTNTEHAGTIRMGYPVYNIVGNSNGSKLYFFNKLQSQHVGLYIYEEGSCVNINADGNNLNDIEKSIGDCIYNPFKNHFLVSEYGDFGASEAVVRVISADAGNSFVQDIHLADQLSHGQYPKEMFISPEGKLYIMVNMHKNGQMTPRIFEYSADDQGAVPAYTFFKTYNVELDIIEDDFDCYSANFCYNSFNRTVYITIHPTELTLDPYNTVINSMFDFLPPTDDELNSGTLIGIKDGSKTTLPLFFPGEVICPGAEYPQIPTEFEGKMYIIGSQFYEYDYGLNTYIVPPGSGPFNDITYAPYFDRMFAIRDSEGECASQRICKIFSIGYNDQELMFEELGSFPGQATSITYNPYDSKVYVYKKFDDKKLGATPVQIFTFDPGAVSFQLIPHDCSFKNIYPELDNNEDFHFYIYNITKPYIDPVNNCIYFPNGGNSSVSKMTFTPDETLPLDPSGFTWLSFPRLLSRIPTNPTVDEVLRYYEPEEPPVYNLIPWGYERDTSWLHNLPPQQSEEIENVFNGTEWPMNQSLTRVDSKYGYKLNLIYDDPTPEKIWLQMQGTVLSANSPLTLYRRYDNWIGYWLYETQSPLDALAPEVLDQLNAIVAQNWICGKYSGMGAGSGQPSTYWLCACHEGKAQLRYGDMVILKTSDGTNNVNFQWQRYGNPVSGKERPETEHFQYTEQPDYMPFVVELDSTQLPTEIGAFVNETCVGATAILPGDTLVMVPGYIEGMTGEVSFEMYYDSLKSAAPAITEYFVENPNNLIRERRTIYTSEKQDYFLVSFKEKQGERYLPNIPGIMVIPNPATEKCLVIFTLPQAGKTSIEIIDLSGRKLSNLSKGYLPAGNHSIQVSLIDTTGNKITEGVYLIEVSCGQFRGQSKLIILR